MKEPIETTLQMLERMNNEMKPIIFTPEMKMLKQREFEIDRTLKHVLDTPATSQPQRTEKYSFIQEIELKLKRCKDQYAVLFYFYNPNEKIR